jgi:hypothetical protein
MYRLGICFFLPVINALVTVQIHRKSYYDPLSSCAFIRNVSLSNDASIQSCIWECDYEPDCQTAVFFYDTKICLTFAELCTTGSIQPSGSIRASVICYRKNHGKFIFCYDIDESSIFRTYYYMSIYFNIGLGCDHKSYGKYVHDISTYCLCFARRDNN